jgi:hypothetical protein
MCGIPFHTYNVREDAEAMYACTPQVMGLEATERFARCMWLIGTGTDDELAASN